MGSQQPASPPSLTLRPATPSDIPDLLPLINRAYRGEASRAGWTTEADLVADARIDAEGLEAKILAPSGAVLVASASPSSPQDTATPPFVACCEVLHHAGTDAAYFGLFAVDPQLQAGGIGGRVLAQAEAYARDVWGARRMEMTVIWTRAELIAWYARRGYVRTGERREFPQGLKPLRDDLYFEVLEKELTTTAAAAA